MTSEPFSDLPTPSETLARRRAAKRQKPSFWRVAWATIAGNLFLTLGSGLYGTMAMLVARRPGGQTLERVIQGWARGLLRASGASVSCHGPDRVPEGPLVLMANHRGLLDIPAIFLTWPGSVRFLAKESLFSIPLFGWGMKAAGFVPVNREDRSRASEAISGASDLLESGLCVVVFPEETRNQSQRILELQRGGFLLALRSGATIVPVGIRGTGSIRRRGSWTVRPGEVTVRYGEPIVASDYGIRRRRELVERTRKSIAELSHLRVD